MASENNTNHTADAGVNSMQSDVSHIRGVLSELPRNGQRRLLEPGSKEEKWRLTTLGPPRRQISQTGAPCGQGWRQRSEPSEEAIGTSRRDL
uniref:Uncharacterized protein n=1 Tax=Haemonchus contortus TaxID=6289 RepID=A0A7I4YXW4_HAECO